MAKTTRTASQRKAEAAAAAARRKAEAEALLKRRRQLRFGLAGLLLVCVLGLSWLFLNRSGSVTGRVLDATRNEALATARLELDGQAQTQSDLTSAFIFSNIKPGKHELRVSAPGFKTLVSNFTLKSGQTLKLEDYRLNPIVSKESLSGPLLAIGTSKPAGLILLGPDLSQKKMLKLRSEPSDVLLVDTMVYAVSVSKDQIDIYDLTAGKITESVELPVNSAPARLVLGQDSNRLMVLNTVGKNVAILDRTQRSLIGTPLPLAFSPRDMHLRSDGNLMVLGPTLMAVLSPHTGSIEKMFSLPGAYANSMRYLASSDVLLLPNPGNVMRVNPLSGDTQTFETGITPEHLEILNDSQFLISLGKELSLYNLSDGVKQLSRTLPGPISALIKYQDQLLVGISSPNKLIVLDGRTLETRKELPFTGSALFGLAHQL